MSVLSRQQQVLPLIRWIISNNMILYIQFLRHISLCYILKHTNVENMREIGEGCKDKLFLSGQRRSACGKDKLIWFQVILFPTSILIFFPFFSWLFYLFGCSLIFFFFFKKPVKVSERSWLKILAFFFLRIISYQRRKNILYDDF